MSNSAGYCLLAIFILFLIIIGIIKITGYDFFIVQNDKIILTRRDINQVCADANCEKLKLLAGKAVSTRVSRERSFFSDEMKEKSSYSYFSWNFPIPKEKADRVEVDKPIQIYRWLIFAYDGETKIGYGQRFLSPLSDDAYYFGARVYVKGKSYKITEHQAKKLLAKLIEICHAGAPPDFIDHGD